MNTIPATSTSAVNNDDVIANSEMLREYLALEQKLVLACRQLKVVKSLLADLQDRYHRAFPNLRSFRYSLRLRMVTVHAVAYMYYHYADRCAAQLADMQAALERLGLLPDSDDVSVSEDSLSDSDDVSVTDSISEDSDLSTYEFDW